MKQNYSKYSSRSESASYQEPEKDTTTSSTHESNAPKTGVVVCRYLNVRSAPNFNLNNVIGILPFETECYILPDERAEGTEFYRIRSKNGVTGYAMKNYILRK